jgi:hypothetical protein
VARQELEVPAIPRDPIAIDCDASGGIEMSNAYDEKAGTRFDLEGWGTAGRIQWLAAGRDGWLCEDADHDGKIASGRELFGTAGGYSDGFEKLALRDSDRNGTVEGPELAGLSIWIDDANPGVTDIPATDARWVVKPGWKPGSGVGSLGATSASWLSSLRPGVFCPS